jgi:hypothetical protein
MVWCHDELVFSLVSGGPVLRRHLDGLEALVVAAFADEWDRVGFSSFELLATLVIGLECQLVLDDSPLPLLSAAHSLSIPRGDDPETRHAESERPGVQSTAAKAGTTAPVLIFPDLLAERTCT